MAFSLKRVLKGTKVTRNFILIATIYSKKWILVRPVDSSSEATSPQGSIDSLL
jgi:hypothetical protein